MSSNVLTIATSRKRADWLLWASLLTGLILVLYAGILEDLVRNWWNDPDYGHGFFVPLFSGYVLWQRREQWQNAKIKPSNFGLLVMIGAVCLLIVGTLGAEFFTSRLSFLILLAGLILFLSGWDLLRAVAFPLGFLVLMIPIPVIIFNQITFPLQLVASRWAAWLLELLGVPVLRDGNILALSNYSLEVVEACSGIRSLMSLIALSVAYGYLAEPRRWVRCVLVVLMIPIALVTNAFRITGAGVLAHSIGPAAAEGFLHEFSGWVIFLAALFLMFASHRVLCLLTKKQRDRAHA